jgi:uncharacterized protein YbjT (DUF2867 family)
MSDTPIYLLCGVGRGTSNIGTLTAENLLDQGHRVRVMVRRDDGRADGLRDRGADVVSGDLANPEDVERALHGAERMFFNLSVSADYLKAAAIVASVARERGALTHLVNMSQMTVSQMTVTSVEESDQQRLHWLVERIFNWSGLPVTHVRPTVFMDNPIFTVFPRRGIAESHELRLPIGDGRTSPIAATDVAFAVATLLQMKPEERGRAFELTGPQVLTLTGFADAYGAGIGDELTPVDVPLDAFAEQLETIDGLSSHVAQHLLTIARLHREDRYNRLTHDFYELTDRRAESLEHYIRTHRALFTGKPV